MATRGQALTWTDDGKLAKTTDKTGDTTYVYDADGNRLIRRDPTGSTLYLPGGTEVRKPTTGTAVGTRYYTSSGNTIAVRTGKTITWMVTDHHGTASATVSNDGLQTVNRQRTLPFGTNRGTNPTAWVGDKGFVGGTKDNTGLTHLGAREYDPTLGRFISVDPLMNLTDPSQWNGYNYANDNPINNSDPNGLEPRPWHDPNYDPATCTNSASQECHPDDGNDPGTGGSGNGGGDANPTPSPSPGPAPVVPSATPINDNGCIGVCIGMAKGGRQNVRDSGLRDVADDELRELERKAKGTEKRRYQKELKARGLKHTGASDSRPRPNPSPAGGNNDSGGDNSTAERAATAAGVGVGIGAILWWSAKLLSPFCGPAAPVCVVVL